MGALPRLGISFAAVIVTAVFVAIVLAIVDLYLTGHGLGSITREVVSAPEGVHLSIGDIILLAVAALAGAMTWALLPASSSPKKGSACPPMS